MRKIGLAIAVLGGWLGTAVTAADFNGDGKNDLGVFRPANGLWAIRDVIEEDFASSGNGAWCPRNALSHYATGRPPFCGCPKAYPGVYLPGPESVRRFLHFFPAFGMLLA